MFIGVKTQLIKYFKAAVPVVAVDSPAPEEESMLQVVSEVAKSLRLPVFKWDCGAQFQTLTGEGWVQVDEFETFNDPIGDAIRWVTESENQGVYILCDVHPYLGSSPERLDYTLVRLVKNMAATLKRSRKRVVILGQGIKLDPSLDGIVYQVENELPDIPTIRHHITQCLQDLQAYEFKMSLDADGIERLVRVSQGLTLSEIGDALRVSAVAGEINASTANDINTYKIQKLKKLGVDFSPAPDTKVGGLQALKLWLQKRTKLFNQQLSGDSNLPTPKGLMLVGVPGGGKSLIAKTIGSEWGVPVLSVDMGAIYGSLVGESEANLRQLLSTAEAISPCVLYFDEIEKALAGMSGASTDSGTSQRVFGKLLSWMNDKSRPVFVVATANNIQGLPPEFLRKGRFDEIFFVDLPTTEERVEIFQNLLSGKEFDLKSLAEASDGFSGGEIKGAIDDAILDSSFDEAQLTTEYILQSLSNVVPVSVRNQEQIKSLRAWAANNARNASVSNKVDAKPATTKRKQQRLSDKPQML